MGSTRSIVVAATGHRPDKLGGYDYYNPQRVWIREQIKTALVDLKADRTISGMALGIDQDFAQVSIEMGLPFIAALPFLDQESRWPKSSQDYWWWLLERADDIVIVSPGEYSAAKMQIRNQFMTDNCNVLIAVWDGSSGGTGNCVNYAERIGRIIHRINPSDFRVLLTTTDRRSF